MKKNEKKERKKEQADLTQPGGGEDGKRRWGGRRAAATQRRGGAKNFYLGGPICVANLLVYTNFYIHTQTHVSIHMHKKLVYFIINP